MPDLASQAVCSEWRLASDRSKDGDCLSGTVKGSKPSMTQCGELPVTDIDHYEASMKDAFQRCKLHLLVGAGVF